MVYREPEETMEQIFASDLAGTLGRKCSSKWDSLFDQPIILIHLDRIKETLILNKYKVDDLILLKTDSEKGKYEVSGERWVLITNQNILFAIKIIPKKSPTSFQSINPITIKKKKEEVKAEIIAGLKSGKKELCRTYVFFVSNNQKLIKKIRKREKLFSYDRLLDLRFFKKKIIDGEENPNYYDSLSTLTKKIARKAVMKSFEKIFKEMTNL